jgi:ELWxxDGT repeat protein
MRTKLHTLRRTLLASVAFVVGVLLLAAPPASGTEVKVVHDINPGPRDSRPGKLLVIDQNLFFVANDGTHGREVWRTDGTAGGTTLVRDILRGRQGSQARSSFSDSEGAPFRNLDGTLLFSARDRTHGWELWRSDGTAGGTYLVRDIFPGDDGSQPRKLTTVGGMLLFTARDPTHGVELWRSDGTEDGTALVSDINPSGSSALSGLTDIGGTLLFAAWDPIHGEELWRADGTEAGTMLVSDIVPGPEGSAPGGFTEDFANVRGTLFFTADDGTHGEELWRSDGTAGGTTLVRDVRPGGASSYPYGLTRVGGNLFYGARDGSHGVELWRSDGTEAGTRLVRDTGPGSAEKILGITDIAGTAFYTANYDELWRSDGTAAGTRLIREFPDGSPGAFTRVGRSVFFAAFTYRHGSELWRTDGTRAGTELVYDNERGYARRGPGPLTRVGRTLFFAASDYRTYGRELWCLKKRPWC